MFNFYHLFYSNCFYYTQVLGGSGGNDGGDDGGDNGGNGGGKDGGNGGGTTNLKAFGLGVVLCVTTIASSFWVIMWLHSYIARVWYSKTLIYWLLFLYIYCSYHNYEQMLGYTCVN